MSEWAPLALLAPQGHQIKSKKYKQTQTMNKSENREPNEPRLLRKDNPTPKSNQSKICISGWRNRITRKAREQSVWNKGLVSIGSDTFFAIKYVLKSLEKSSQILTNTFFSIQETCTSLHPLCHDRRDAGSKIANTFRTNNIELFIQSPED